MKKRLTLKNTIIILLILFSTYSFISQQFKMNKIKGDIKAQRQELESLKQKNQKLQDEIDLSKTDLYMEKQARERLGYVKPGETPVIDKKSN